MHSDAASRASKTPSEWARDMLLRSAIVRGPLEMQTHIFTELVGVQMLLINTREPLLRGDKIHGADHRALPPIQTVKAAQAQELLARRSQDTDAMIMATVQQWGAKSQLFGRHRGTLLRLELSFSRSS
jgi:hypothetical protein